MHHDAFKFVEQGPIRVVVITVFFEGTLDSQLTGEWHSFTHFLVMQSLWVDVEPLQMYDQNLGLFFDKHLFSGYLLRLATFTVEFVSVKHQLLM